ncbi:pre-toxin TG domain-containing protein [Fusobacterium hwasookii]|nr:pre-toxin TG domain-containing protein [Fusobacterium hwasookii]QNE69313.1 pre-toxin TG domain-containing protein [Fusobacterium hwasookii]
MDEINDIGNVIANTIDNKGEDKRNFFGILRAQRGATDLYNISGDSLNLLNEAYKSNKIGADEYKEGLRNIIEATGNDLGLNVSLVYLDTSTMPKDSEGSTGSFYIVDRKNRKVLIPIDVNKIEDIKELLGTLTEEVAHGKDALEGRQDKKVAEDKSNDEEGLETLGRPANEYVKKKFGEDNNSKISLTTDGIDLSNADVGEKVGDYLPKHEIDAAGGVEKVLTPTTNEKIFKVVRLKSNQEVAVEFYQGATNKSLWSTIYDATPGLGDAKGVIEGLTGEDAITGEKLNMFQRIIGGLPAIGRVADAFVTINKPIKKGADYIINYFISDASKGISKLDNVNDTAKLATVAEGVGDSSNITKSFVKEIKMADDTADIAKASKNVEKISDVSKEYQNLINYEKKQELVRIKKDVKEIIKEQASAKEAKVIDKSSDIAKNSESIIDSTKNTVDKTVNILNKNKDLYYEGRKVYTAKELNQMGRVKGGSPNRGVEYIYESPAGKQAAQEFQWGTEHSMMQNTPAGKKNVVPALRYDNPNIRGMNFIKFDGIEVENGVTCLIDLKINIPYWNKGGMKTVRKTLERISEAKKQNPGIRVIYEFPNETAAGHLRSWINDNGYDGIVEIRVRK